MGLLKQVMNDNLLKLFLTLAVAIYMVYIGVVIIRTKKTKTKWGSKVEGKFAVAIGWFFVISPILSLILLLLVIIR